VNLWNRTRRYGNDRVYEQDFIAPSIFRAQVFSPKIAKLRTDVFRSPLRRMETEYFIYIIQLVIHSINRGLLWDKYPKKSYDNFTINQSKLRPAAHRPRHNRAEYTGQGIKTIVNVSIIRYYPQICDMYPIVSYICPQKLDLHKIFSILFNYYIFKISPVINFFHSCNVN